MTEKKVLIKDIETNYKIFGQGTPFLILHGWGSNSDRWQKVAELLADRNIRVIVPDLPGFGKSEEPREAWSLDNYVEWVKEFSNNLPELKGDFCLLGHSFGGAIASKFSIKYNQKIEKLFLVGAAAIRKKTIKNQMSGGISKFVKLFNFLPFYDSTRKAFYKFVVGSNDYLRVNGVMKETFSIISEDLSNYLSFIKVPTVIIWGSKDNATLIKDAYFINRKIENSKLVIIPGADHSLNVKIPEILAERVLNEIK